LKETAKPIFFKKKKQHQAMKLKKKINKKQYQSALYFQTRDLGYQTGSTRLEKITKLNL
jgi:hypothetical protein